MRSQLSITVFVGIVLPSIVHAQHVQVCLPEQATSEMSDALTVELRAHGCEVSFGCALDDSSAAWHISFEAEDALADVWVRAISASGEERRARIGGPLDTLDARAMALTAASLLEEEPVLSEPPHEPEPPHEQSNLVQPALSDVSPEIEEVEIVESTRTLALVHMFELSALTGVIADQQGIVGGRFGYALHLAPWLRFRMPIMLSVAPDQGAHLLMGAGFDFVIGLQRGESWLELGLAVNYGTRPIGDMMTVPQGIGPSVHVGLFYAISDSWRVFVRGEGTVLFDLDTGDPQYGFYLSSGFAVIL